MASNSHRKKQKNANHIADIRTHLIIAAPTLSMSGPEE